MTVDGNDVYSHLIGQRSGEAYHVVLHIPAMKHKVTQLLPTGNKSNDDDDDDGLGWVGVMCIMCIVV